MVSRSNDAEESALLSSRTPGTPVKTRLARSGTSPTKRDDKSSKPLSKDDSELKDYVCIIQRQLSQVHTNGVKQLGDCLGKGAFGSVYRALNWNTGETVAVKQIKLADLPKSELRVIMVRIQSTVRVISKLAADEPLQLEIDLLKALDVSSGSDDVCGLLIN